MNCQKNECPNVAEVALCIKIPAMNVSIDEHEPISVAINLKLCRSCLAKEDVHVWLSHNNNYLKLMVARQVQALGKQPPDFNRAWLEGIALDGPELKILTQNQN